MSWKDTSFDSGSLKLNPFEDITEYLITKGHNANNNETQTKHSSLISNYLSALRPIIGKMAKILRDVPVIKHCVGPPDETNAQIDKLIAQQKAATSYKEWMETSVLLDKLLNNSTWKDEEETTLYDYQLVKARLEELREARLSKNYKALLYIIRTTWTRNMANMDNINLYRHSSVGTKSLIEEYIAECQLCLQDFANGESNLDDSYVLAMLIQTRKNYGRVAITMSGGGCFGMLEIGVFSTLLELDLLPKIVSGSSSGSILSSIMCSKTTPELLEILDSLSERKFEVFEKDDDPDSFLSCLGRLLKYGTWFENVHLQETMKDFLGDLTFKEAYNRTGRILNITVSSASVHEQPSLLNYLTAPNVLVWSAVCASCSLPGVFPSSTIYEKNYKTGKVEQWSNLNVKFVDGSMHADIPIKRLSEMFNVNHVIACQVNPHVVPFLKMSIQCVGGEIENEYSARFKQFLNQVYGLISTEAMHYLEVASELGIATNICTKIRAVLAQSYSGDITILPELRMHELNKLLANPSPEFLLDAVVRGARATWPKVSIIKNHCSLEFALDKCITMIRSRLISSSSRNLTNLPVSLIPRDKTKSNLHLALANHKGANYHGNPKKKKNHNNHNRRNSETLSAGLPHDKDLSTKASYPNLKAAHINSTPSRIFTLPSAPTIQTSAPTKPQKLYQVPQQAVKQTHGLGSAVLTHRNTISSLPTSPYSSFSSRRAGNRKSFDGTQNLNADETSIFGGSVLSNGLESATLSRKSSIPTLNNRQSSRNKPVESIKHTYLSKMPSEDDFNRILIGTMDDDLTFDFMKQGRQNSVSSAERYDGTDQKVQDTNCDTKDASDSEQASDSTNEDRPVFRKARYERAESVMNTNLGEDAQDDVQDDSYGGLTMGGFSYYQTGPDEEDATLDYFSYGNSDT